MRGNLLSLEKVWQRANSPTAPFLPVAAHLTLVWREGLPYWQGLNERDIQQMEAFAGKVAALMAAQQTKLKWLNSTVGMDKPYSELYPAYVPVSVPAGLELQEAVLSDCASPQSLVSFIWQALVQENIQAWPVATQAVEGEVAVVNAPWFCIEPDGLVARHVAVAVAKVDYYVFK